MKERLSQRVVGRRTLLSAAALAPLAAATRPSNAVAAVDPAQGGEWSAPFDMGGVAIHATLLRNDDVLIFQYVEGQAGVDHTSWVGTWNWRSRVTQDAPFSYHRDVFCAGHNVLPDGRVFIAGGHDHTTGKKQDPVGVAETDIYNPANRTWTPTWPLGEKRWYPTNVGLPNGRTLVFGGQARAGAASNTVDEYDPRTNTMRRLASTATKPVGMYPRMHVVANGKVFKSGPQRMGAYFNPSTSSWSNVAPMLYGSRGRGSVVLLPGSQKVLTVGGQSSGSAPATATAEILDTAQAAPKWRYTGSMNHPRVLPNAVVLPDAQVLVVGGGAAFKYTNPVMVPELYNPVTETWAVMAPQQAGRMYHATALLLPDGRVLSAGQDNGPLARHGEIFSPPYLFRGARPTISGAPASVSQGGQLQFTSFEAADIAKVVLIRPGSSTHEIDTDQRSVPLSFTASGSTVTAQVPGNANEAPVGYYMLFAVNGSGVPSVAPWVHID
jgi:hypothetical protein